MQKIDVTFIEIVSVMLSTVAAASALGALVICVRAIFWAMQISRHARLKRCLLDPGSKALVGRRFNTAAALLTYEKMGGDKMPLGATKSCEWLRERDRLATVDLHSWQQRGSAAQPTPDEAFVAALNATVPQGRLLSNQLPGQPQAGKRGTLALKPELTPQLSNPSAEKIPTRSTVPATDPILRHKRDSGVPPREEAQAAVPAPAAAAAPAAAPRATKAPAKLAAPGDTAAPSGSLGEPFWKRVQRQVKSSRGADAAAGQQQPLRRLMTKSKKMHIADNYYKNVAPTQMQDRCDDNRTLADLPEDVFQSAHESANDTLNDLPGAKAPRRSAVDANVKK